MLSWWWWLMGLCCVVPLPLNTLKEGGRVGCDSAAGVHRPVHCFQKTGVGRRRRDLSCTHPGATPLKPSIVSLTQGEHRRGLWSAFTFGDFQPLLPCAPCTSFPGIHPGLALRSPVCREALCEPVQVRAQSSCDRLCGVTLHLVQFLVRKWEVQGPCSPAAGNSLGLHPGGASWVSRTYLRPRDSERKRWVRGGGEVG